VAETAGIANVGRNGTNSSDWKTCTFFWGQFVANGNRSRSKEATASACLNADTKINSHKSRCFTRLARRVQHLGQLLLPGDADAVLDVPHEVVGAAKRLLADVAAEEALVQMHDGVMLVQLVPRVERLVADDARRATLRGLGTTGLQFKLGERVTTGFRWSVDTAVRSVTLRTSRL